MSTIVFSIVGGLLAGIIVFIWNSKKKLSERLKEEESSNERNQQEAQEQIDFMHTIASEMAGQIGKLEHAITTQLVNRSSEVGSPPPSGAYHTVFLPTGEGRVLMIYICLDTGHVARWHFHSPEALESEGQRLLRVAQQVREKTLPDNPEILNIHIGSSGMIH